MENRSGAITLTAETNDEVESDSLSYKHECFRVCLDVGENFGPSSDDLHRDSRISYGSAEPLPDN